MTDLAARYEASLAPVVDRWRREEHAARPELGPCDAAAGPAAGDWVFPLGAGDRERLAAVRRLWFELVGVYCARARHQALVDHLGALKDRRLRRVPAPGRDAVRRAVADGCRRLPPLGLAPVGDGGY